MPGRTDYDVIVIGGGHAGAEAAWAAANMLRDRPVRNGRVALVTMDPSKIGAMSCNPAIGGLAKGQIVREVDALGGLMGLAADATGIQFRVLNASKGPAVRGPRCQSDKYRYADEVQRLLATRENLDILAGTVDEFFLRDGRMTGVVYTPSAACNTTPWRERQAGESWGDSCCSGEYFTGPHGEDPILAPTRLNARAVVLTTGTFMRGLMHTGEAQTPGGRVGEKAAGTISDALRKLGFELGRLKTGTPPRLDGRTLDVAGLELQPGDDRPVPFSDMTGVGEIVGGQSSLSCSAIGVAYEKVAGRFPVLEQRPCWITHTNAEIHELIRANLDRAPMYNGQIATAGPRYCPSIEDKVVRFADRTSHHVFLEPESLSTDEIYCNGISTSLPGDVQERIVRQMPGCERATILRYGYAVEYDMVLPHQIDATAMTKRVPGLFLAGQINGTTGYEEAAGQGLVAGVNAVRFVRDEEPMRLGRDEAYIGVLMDDLVTKTPREPYRMFTSRAEFRLLLRADNSDERLTPMGRGLGLVDDARWQVYEARRSAMDALRGYMDRQRVDGVSLTKWARRPRVDVDALHAALSSFSRVASDAAKWGAECETDADTLPPLAYDRRTLASVLADLQYAGYIDRQRREVEQLRDQEASPLPTDLDYATVKGLRSEAADVLNQFKPTTFGQAGRLAGVNPADLMVVSLAVGR
ncbi:tRNA uridine-5-carboxymethylaminomethyl(34) synthesis enzyme MnmG [Phycisphaerales bacterium AB-hyl4]|uniref:tRNA uridine 5-carboxymethylaminomethyl modification enzyme MnmG n=1 Tax=Natronomicrosphaera hydrolytica TaxID=3242702 RepID=A0ABV4U5R5_9BACT